MKWFALLLLPTLLCTALFADVEMGPPLTDTPQSNNATSNNDVAKNARPNVSTANSKPMTATAGMVGLRLKPSVSSPVVMTLPQSDVQASAQEAGVVADGQKWMSVEHAVTLVGYVDKVAIDKDLTVSRGTTVWTSNDKAEQLTVIDDPTSARLLEVDHMGKVEVKEPRVLYYGIPMQETLGIAPAPLETDVKPVDDATAKRRGISMQINDTRRRTIEGTLHKGNALFGRRLYLSDPQGQTICRIDPNSSIDWLTFSQYIGHTAVFVGELHENGNDLVLTVSAIRMR